jgi:hypothetical protein
VRLAIVATFLLTLAGAADALACPSCFGQPDGPLAESARVGMWVLLGFTLALQAAMAAFFLHLRRRAAQARQRDREVAEEWSRLQAAWDAEGTER